MIVIRILALILLFAVATFLLWVVIVNLTRREDSRWYGGRPSTLGVRDGKLAGPKRTPNSVLSDGIATTHPAYVAPLPFAGEASVAMAKLAAIVKAMEGATVITVDHDYLHAEFRSKTMRFTDDFEARTDAASNLIHLRSASRLGRRDYNVNRERIETIRAKFTTG